MVLKSEAHQAPFCYEVQSSEELTCSQRVSYSAHKMVCLSIIYTTSSVLQSSAAEGELPASVSVSISWSLQGERDAEQLAVVIYKVHLQALRDEVWQVREVLLAFCGKDEAGDAGTLCLEEQTDSTRN